MWLLTEGPTTSGDMDVEVVSGGGCSIWWLW